MTANKQECTNYVPKTCAETLLREATREAEENKARNEEFAIKLEATYREVNERTRRYYDDILLELQKRTRREFSRLSQEHKEKDELVEDLRDKIASLTAKVAEQESAPAAGCSLEREKQFRALVARITSDDALRPSDEEATVSSTGAAVAEVGEQSDGADASMHEQNQVETFGRQGGQGQLTLVGVPGKTEGAAVQSTAEDPRESPRHAEADMPEVRASVASTLQTLIQTLEQREDAPGRELLRDGLPDAQQEADKTREDPVKTAGYQKLVTGPALHPEAAGADKKPMILEEEQAQMEPGEVIGPRRISATPPQEHSGEAEVEQDNDASVWRSRLEFAEAARMIDAEERWIIMMELVRCRRESEEARAQAAATAAASASSMREKEEASTGGVAMAEVLSHEPEAPNLEAGSGEESTSERPVTETTAALVEGPGNAGDGAPIVHAGDPSDDVPRTSCGEADDDVSRGKDDMGSSTAGKAPSETDATPRSREQLNAELRAATVSKKKVKEEIKIWLRNFEEREGRPASNEDKAAIKPLFLSHKRLERTIHQLNAELSALEEPRSSREEIPPSSGEVSVSNAVGGPPATTGGVATATLADVVIAASKASRMDFLEQENAWLRSQLAEAEAHLSSANVQESAESRCGDSSREAEHIVSTGGGGGGSDPPRRHSIAGETSSLEAELSRLSEELEVERSSSKETLVRLQESERKKDLMKTALGRLNETTTRMFSELAATSAAADSGADPESVEYSRVAELEGVLKGFQEEQLSLIFVEPQAKEAESGGSHGAEPGRLGEASQGLREETVERRISQLIVGDVDPAASRLRDQAEKLQNLERELENLREREKDARVEANKTFEELECLRAKHGQRQEREGDLLSSITGLEDEKEVLVRVLVMTEERVALALELIEAQREDGAQARQEAAINAATLRRASRDGALGPTKGGPLQASRPDTDRPKAIRPQATSSSVRQHAEKLRVAAGILVHAIREGTDLWRNDRRAECHTLYAKAGARAAGQMPRGQALEDLRVTLAAAKGLSPAKAAVSLRKAFDAVIQEAMVAKEAANAERAERRGLQNSPATSPKATVKHAEASRVSPTPTTNAKTINPDQPESSEKRDAACAVVEPHEALSPGSTYDEKGENSRVASLRRQFELLTARYEASEVAATAAKLAADMKIPSVTRRSSRSLEGTSERRLGDAARRCVEMGNRIEELEEECRKLRKVLEDGTGVLAGEEGSHGQKDSEGQVEGNNLAADEGALQPEKKDKQEASKVRKLEIHTSEAAGKPSKSTAAGASRGVREDRAGVSRTTLAEGKIKKELGDAEKRIQKLEASLQTTSKALGTCNADLKNVKEERDGLQKQVKSMESMSKELQRLQARAEDAARLDADLKEATAEQARIEGLYKTEQQLRKKYWNMIEDMKGKIRVFARCRPMARYEIERKCQAAVTFVDGQTLEVSGQHGPKQYVFDAVFTEKHGQETIFSDMKNLVQSAVDGYNVCVFAYGQTGSGKTYTMSGGEGENRGLTPRAIEEVFDIIAGSRGNLKARVSCYFVELYLDNLRDLFFAMENPQGAPPKLDIKLNEQKMVFLKNVVTKEATTAEELLRLFSLGNAHRKVSGTKMNAESSRSHSIFSILLEVANRTSRKTTTGKLSLVDLAGSERASKTGATAERLKEAQSINKSLSALGDVISALSTNEKFVPYRNNKLTQVMQDSLGGNAKTLMFVNISPADYNQDETSTALTYATRVKQITNEASKQQDSAQVAKLKETIRKLRAGEDVDDDGGA